MRSRRTNGHSNRQPLVPLDLTRRPAARSAAREHERRSSRRFERRALGEPPRVLCVTPRPVPLRPLRTLWPRSANQLLHALAVGAAGLEARAVTQREDVVPLEPRLHALDAVGLDDERAMDAKNARGRKAALEIGQR